MAILKRLADKKRRIVNFRATNIELEQIRKNAKAYCGGSISTWIIAAALDYKPRSCDMTDSAKRTTPEPLDLPDRSGRSDLHDEIDILD